MDAFIVGPNDLAGSMGHIGRPNHPDMLPVHARLAKLLARAGRPFGVSMGYEPEHLKRWLDMGAQILFCGNDAGYVHEGASAVLSGLGALIGERTL